MTNTRTPGIVMKHSLAHFSTSVPGTRASAVNGFPRASAKMLPNDTRVLPVPHSAMAAAVRAVCQRRRMPIMAAVWTANGFRFSRPISGATGSPGWYNGGK